MYIQLKRANMRQSRFSKVNFLFVLLHDIISPLEFKLENYNNAICVEYNYVYGIRIPWYTYTMLDKQNPSYMGKQIFMC